MQYAVSFNDIMSTYGTAKTQDSYYIEGIAGIINLECEKGARYINCVYVDDRPAILVFDNGK